MDLFKDKKYESFDELTQLIEPFIFPINDAMSQLPSEFTVTLEDIMAIKGDRGVVGGYLSTFDAITYLLKKLKIQADTNELYNHIREFYAFQIAQGATVDMSNLTISGEIKLVRRRELYTDEEIMALMVRSIENNLTSNVGRASDVPASRFHELAESFGFLDEMKKCSTFKERKLLTRQKIVASLTSNEIRIRDFNLGIRFSLWVRKWLSCGSLAALKNIAMLKVVSHEGNAIYSINEELI